MRFWEAMMALEQEKKVIIRHGECSAVIISLSEMCKFLEDRSGNSRGWIHCNLNGKWEIYEEPGLTFSQVLEGLKKGGRFRRKDWKRATCFLATMWEDCEQIFCDDSGERFDTLSIQDIEATDWVEVK